MAWKGFAQRDDEQMTAFRQFVAEQGDSLFWQAAFDALHAQQVKEDEMRWGWPAWPEMYQNVDSPEVRQFCEEHRDDVDFLSLVAVAGLQPVCRLLGDKPVAMKCRLACIVIWRLA